MFMAPEQALGANIDQRADLFSLGSVYYMMLSGHPPFRASSTVAVLKRVAEDTPRPIREVIPEVPQWLCDIVSRLHEKDPQKRLQSAQEVVELLLGGDREELRQRQVADHRGSLRDPTLDHGAIHDHRLGLLKVVSVVALLLAVLGMFELAGITHWSRRESGSTSDQPIAAATNQVGHASNHNSHHPAVDRGTLTAPETKPSKVESDDVPTQVAALPVTTVTAPMPEPVAPPIVKPRGKEPLRLIAPFDAKEARGAQEQWAHYLGTTFEFTNRLGMTFRVIPPGEFLMGSTEDDVHDVLNSTDPDGTDSAEETVKVLSRLMAEVPQHRVRLTQPFALSVHEVTVGQFRRFVESTKYKTVCEVEGTGVRFNGPDTVRDPNASWKHVGYEQADDFPVWNILPEDAEAFCKWLGEQDGRTYQLPTEAQWEFACRAGTGTRCYWGEARRQNRARTSKGNSGLPGSVGTLVPNAFGMFDMCGNVWEYCADGFDADFYATSPVDDPLGPLGKAPRKRVTRGGGARGEQIGISSTFRRTISPTPSLVGFRVAIVGRLKAEAP